MVDVRHIILISGKDSLATALLQTARAPDLPYEYVFTDVMAELPETYAWIARVEAATGWKIVRLGKSLLELIEANGGFLPGHKSRYCTRECKIEPTEEYIGTDDCTVYYGLRADEARTGYVPFGKPNITVAYPLRDCDIDLRGVYLILDVKNLCPPDFFWGRLYDAVARKLTSWPDWEGRLSRPERAALFAGRSRSNCFFCFFQKQYEFLWLYETHPGLYEQAAAMEKEDYSFQTGIFLRELRCADKRRKIFDRRVKEVCGDISRKYQSQMFEDTGDNELALVSCGLLCGK